MRLLGDAPDLARAQLDGDVDDRADAEVVYRTTAAIAARAIRTKTWPCSVRRSMRSRLSGSSAVGAPAPAPRWCRRGAPSGVRAMHLSHSVAPDGGQVRSLRPSSTAGIAPCECRRCARDGRGRQRTCGLPRQLRGLRRDCHRQARRSNASSLPRPEAPRRRVRHASGGAVARRPAPSTGLLRQLRRRH